METSQKAQSPDKKEANLAALRARRASLVIAEAELKLQEVERKREAKKAELEELTEKTLHKVEQLAELRLRLLGLLAKSDQLTSRNLVPAWLNVQPAVSSSKAKLEAFCSEQGLPQPNYRRGCRELEKAAPWLPLPLVKAICQETGEVSSSTHPAYLGFGAALAAYWPINHSERVTDNEESTTQPA